MTDSATYSVVLSGNLRSGFDTEQVTDAFARLFKLPPEKASRIIGSKFVIKRDIDLPIAKIYQEKLANIGIEVVLQQHGGLDELALAPIEPPAPGDGGDSAAVLAGGEMICPKCELRQPRAEECSGCGVIISKVPPPAEFTVKVAAQAPQPDAADAAEHPAEIDGRTGSAAVKWAIASSLLAVVAVLAWFAIA